MKIRRAIAMYAILGLVALGAMAASAQPALCCGGGAKQTSAGASGGCPHMTKTADGGGCPMGKGSGSCSYMAGGACGSMSGSHQCNMSAADCEKMIRTYYKNHGWLGVEMACASADDMNPTVTKVFPGSPAEAAGLKVGDVLVSVNGIAYGPDSAEALQKLTTEGMKAGDTLTYQVQRSDESTDLQVKATLVKAPKAALAAMIADHKGSAHKADQDESSKKS